jgi:hypothetical protein
MPRAAQINRLGAPAWPSTEIALAVQAARRAFSLTSTNH